LNFCVIIVNPSSDWKIILTLLKLSFDNFEETDKPLEPYQMALDTGKDRHSRNKFESEKEQ